MKHFYKSLLLLLVFASGYQVLSAQNKEEGAVNMEDIEIYKKQTESLVRYFEGTLNFLGNPKTTVQEKEIVIYESYDKIFASDLVQIEDDLDEKRDVPINKNVQAYLKDVDFFFKSAVFLFDIQSIEPMVAENGGTFFKVTLMRQLNGRNIENDSINSSRLRYIEVNLDPFKKDLKIVSYYTTKINERQELRNWWSQMPQAWKSYFGSKSMVFDTLAMDQIAGIKDDGILLNAWIEVPRYGTYLVVGPDTIPEAKKDQLFNRPPDTVIVLNDVVRKPILKLVKTDLAEVDNRLKQFSLIKKLDISYNNQITTLEPLTQLTDLEEIDFSNTPVNDLSPLRNHNKINAIYMSGSNVSDLSPLQYAINIREVYCFDTKIKDINVLNHFRQLEKLYCFNTGIASLEPLTNAISLVILKTGNTSIRDLNPLRKLVNLRVLDLSQTAISDISALSELRSLQQLNIDFTAVKQLEPVRNLEALTMIQFSNTLVSDLSSLQSLPDLKRIYSDKNGVSAAMATAFMRSRPGVLVVYDSEELKLWWNDLPIYWKAIFTEQSGINATPDTEELVQVINLSKLDLNGNAYLQNMQPVQRLVNLKELNLSKTEITDLEPISGLSDLKKIDISNTRISNLKALKQLFQLEELNIENTRVDSLGYLYDIKSLKLVLADKSRLTTPMVLELKKKLPGVLVVYQTESLVFWWNNLDDGWKEILAENLPLGTNPTHRQLQIIADQKELQIKDVLSINSLEALKPMVLLEKLIVKGTTVNDLSTISQLKQLRYLDLSGNPIVDLKPISGLTQMENLSIENTPVSDLDALSGLLLMKLLNAGGTQIKSLKPLAGMLQLEELSIYNTRIKSLSPADELPALKHLKCYNTKISSKTIDKLKEAKPSLNILYY